MQMTEKHWAGVYYTLITSMFLCLNIGLISLILQKPKPALGDRGVLTIALVIIDVIALAQAWATWYHARHTASSPAPRSPVAVPARPGRAIVKERNEPTLKSAFFLFAFCLTGAMMIGDCLVTFANPRERTFPAGFRWAMIPPGAIFFLVFLAMSFFIGRFIVRALWKKWRGR